MLQPSPDKKRGSRSQTPLRSSIPPPVVSVRGREHRNPNRQFQSPQSSEIETDTSWPAKLLTSQRSQACFQVGTASSKV